jgi:hypothetical protein
MVADDVISVKNLRTPIFLSFLTSCVGQAFSGFFLSFKVGFESLMFV